MDTILPIHQRMNWLSSMPIRKKLTVIIVGICLIALVMTSIVQVVVGLVEERKQRLDKLMVTAKVIAMQSRAPLEFIDPSAAKENLSSLQFQSPIVLACLYDETKQVFAYYQRTNSENQAYDTNNSPCPQPQKTGYVFGWKVLQLFANVQPGANKIGTLYFEYDLSEMYSYLAREEFYSFLIIAFALFIAYVLSFYFQQMVSRPLVDLAEKTRQFSESHDYSIRAIKFSNDELGELADDFNNMVGEIQKHELQLEQAIDELSKSNTQLERFAYICSHDLQEPLRMISNYTQLLERHYKESLGEDGKEYMAYIIDGASRMRELINDILAYSRISNSVEQPHPVDLQEVMSYIMKNLALTIEESNAKVVVGKMPVIVGHKPLLAQVFQNLLTNALKFCKDKAPEIEVGAEHLENEWKFYVKDNGIGIDPQYHKKVFEIFQRLNRREEYRGTGIGLAICKKAVEHHGGRIWIESALGKGSAFFFTIPDNITREAKP